MLVQRGGLDGLPFQAIRPLFVPDDLLPESRGLALELREFEAHPCNRQTQFGRLILRLVMHLQGLDREDGLGHDARCGEARISEAAWFLRERTASR